MSDKKINADGSVQGEFFSGKDYKGIYPSPRMGETYAEYHARVNAERSKGFHLGDLSWSDYRTYCMGSGQYESADADAVIK